VEDRVGEAVVVDDNHSNHQEVAVVELRAVVEPPGSSHLQLPTRIC